ncbi:anthranilate/aminodeoxychorismate synthase component II [candidate division BRC1 bacterium HGW-BRC1-1]|jgi:anthranilate synthase/aminodeoxychorismate synthase-like glutamine amidotransferase|nr:MAG: anthranilate/aminodeoxychorismate synthase component II [candidate division BRC1 bacterium HGW-BRC1-1]
MILIIDNYDSFTYNLVQYFGELGAEMKVVRNDKIDMPTILDIAPRQIVISPGPCTPDDAGVSMEVVRIFGEQTPILGVCLGHQCIGQVYGGKVIRAPLGVVHGKTSHVHHENDALFENVPSPFQATRYHSLVVERESLPADLKVTAWSDEGVVMAMRHETHPVWGVQFHPESILTAHGHTILQNFLNQKI